MAQSRILVQNDKGKRRTFSRSAWEKLGTNKYGWKPVAEPPPEVKELENKSAQSSGDENKSAPAARNANRNRANKPSIAKSTKSSDAPAPAADRPNVQATIKLIKAAKSASEVDKIVKGDDRATVIKAADHRKTEF